MDVLLINTPIFRVNRDPNADDSVPPIGIGYIYTQLTHAGYECEFVDAVAEGFLPDEVIKLINESDAQFIGLNVFSSNLTIARNIVEGVESPKKFLLGGPAIRALVSDIEGWKPTGDITVVIGDAELALPKILKESGQNNDRFSTIHVVHIESDSPCYPADIDLPLDRSIFKNEPVDRPDLGIIESHIIASRGCLYDCAFCTAARSLNTGNRPRFRTYTSLAKEIEEIRHMHPKTTCIRVLDDLFIRSQASIKLAAELFSENNLYWRSMAHVNTFNNLPNSFLESIKKSGCKELFVGIESGNNDTLRHIRKPFTTDIAYKTVCRILDAKIPVKCYFILGFPGETNLEAQDTIAFASRLREYADKIGVQFRISSFRFRPYHGTTLFDELIKEGKTIKEIQNRIETSEVGSIDPYDCVAGIYSQYDEDTLNHYMNQMRKLDVHKLS